MVDVLSQNEIDALLAALSSGEMDADELKKKKPRKNPLLRFQTGCTLLQRSYPKSYTDP